MDVITHPCSNVNDGLANEVMSWTSNDILIFHIGALTYASTNLIFFKRLHVHY